MIFLKECFKNRKLIFGLGKNDFRNKFASTSLGAIWGFIQPFIFILTYVIVFQYILKTGSAGDYPYLVWFLPGLAAWMFINDAIITASSSIRSYSYLVKKIVFPVDIIPIISIVSSSIVGLFLFIIAFIICGVMGYIINFIAFLYLLIGLYCAIIAITRFTSALTTLIPDFANLLQVLMQLFFWFTPIIWNINMLSASPVLTKIINCLPFTYLINGFREAFVGKNILMSGNILYTVVFWSFIIIIFLWGNSIFKRSKKDFADVL